MAKVSIRGASALAADFRALERAERGPTLKKGARAGAKVAQKAIQGRAPVRSGVLRKNIVLGSQRSQSPGTQQTVIVRIKKGGKRKYANTKANVRARKAGKTYEQAGPAFYGPMIELGTSKMAAKPFFRPAFDSAEEEIAKATEDAIAEEIDRVLAGAR